VKLTKPEARALAVIASRLDRRPSRRAVNRDDVLETFRHLGTIQLDTISVISRSHETVLWSRLGAYDPTLVTSLYEDDHALTEYIVHAASILPAELLSLFRPYMEHARASGRGPLANPEERAIADAIIERIAAEGPMTSRHFEAPPDAERLPAWHWWGNKPERRLMTYLWIDGELMIHKRDAGFARHFDLPDRVVPGFWDGDALPREEASRQILRHAIRALGVTTAKWAADYFRTGGRPHVLLPDVRRLMLAFEEEGAVLPVEVPGIDEPVWMDADLQERLALLRERKGWPTLTTFLSPFDNLTWNRLRGEQLWDFDYRLECYVPAPKRVYGYYSLPILHRGTIIGRLDPSYDRRSGVLTIKALHLEPGVRVGDSMIRSIVRAIEDLLRFLGGQPGAWRLLHVNRPEILSMLRLYGDVDLRAAD
jgi:uncharacterized protein